MKLMKDNETFKRKNLIEKDLLRQNTLLNVDDYYRMVGEFGIFHWILEMMFAFMFIVPALQIYIMIFAAPELDWKCVEGSTVCYLKGPQTSKNNFRCNISRSEWEFVQDEGTKTVTVDFDLYCGSSWLIYMTSSVFYFGRLVGIFVMGWMADVHGRKRALYPAYICVIFAQMLEVMVPNIWLFLVFRFLCGFFVAGVFNNILVLLSELVSTRYRALANNIIWMVWISGLCFSSLLAYYIRNWKTLFIICSAPYLLALLSYWFIPESPRWLRTEGRLEEAQKVFKKIAKWNKTKVEVKTSLSRPIKNIDEQHTTPLTLFKSDMVKSTFSQAMIWFANGLVYFGLSSTAGDLGGSVYLNFFLLSLAEAPSNALAAYLPNRFGRKKIITIPLILAGIFCVSIGFIPLTDDGKILRVAFGVLGKFFCTVSFNTIVIWSFELFPTNIRSKGMSLGFMSGNVGSTASPWIAQGLKVYSDPLPYLIMGGVALFGSLAGFALEETNGKDAKDTREQRVHEFIVENTTAI